MFRRKRHRPADPAADLVAAGAPADTADAIVDALLGAGLSIGEAQEWIGHPNRAYPHDWPTDVFGEVKILKAGSMWLVEKGHTDTVFTAARAFAGASADERAIARLFGSHIQDARRLTGSDPGRAAVIAEIARTIEAHVGASENVCRVGQTRLPDQGDRRIVDRLLAGEEAAVRDELARGDLDPRRLLRSGDLILIGW